MNSISARHSIGNLGTFMQHALKDLLKKSPKRSANEASPVQDHLTIRTGIRAGSTMFNVKEYPRPHRPVEPSGSLGTPGASRASSYP